MPLLFKSAPGRVASCELVVASKHLNCKVGGEGRLAEVKEKPARFFVLMLLQLVLETLLYLAGLLFY